MDIIAGIVTIVLAVTIIFGVPLSILRSLDEIKVSQRRVEARWASPTVVAQLSPVSQPRAPHWRVFAPVRRRSARPNRMARKRNGRRTRSTRY